MPGSTHTAAIVPDSNSLVFLVTATGLTCAQKQSQKLTGTESLIWHLLKGRTSKSEMGFNFYLQNSTYL